MTPKGSTPVSPTRLRTTALETNHVEPRALGQAPKPGHWLVCSEMSIQGGNPKVCTPTTQEDDLVLSAGNTLIKAWRESWWTSQSMGEGAHVECSLSSSVTPLSAGCFPGCPSWLSLQRCTKFCTQHWVLPTHLHVPCLSQAHLLRATVGIPDVPCTPGCTHVWKHTCVLSDKCDPERGWPLDGQGLADTLTFWTRDAGKIGLDWKED